MTAAETKNPSIALVGTPNVGKTVVFNKLTGLHQKVANWPGTTVSVKQGTVRFNGKQYSLVDLPGTHALSDSSADQIVTRDFLLAANPVLVINVIDAAHIEQNLYLTTLLMEMGLNAVIALNMQDLAKSSGIQVDAAALQRKLGIPVIETVAPKGKGIAELKAAIEDALTTEIKTCCPEFPSIQETAKKVAAILSFAHTTVTDWHVHEAIQDAKYPFDLMEPWDREKARERIRELVQTELGDDSVMQVITARYEFVEQIVAEAVETSEALPRTADLLDCALTHRRLGIPVFLAFMWLTFDFTFEVSTPLVIIVEMFFEWVAVLFDGIDNEILHSLLVDGIRAGIGFPMVFLPQIAFMFLALGVLEDTGYIARAVFVMDRWMRMVGLTGKSLAPMLIGFGCNVPGIMATRSIEDENDRILTILVNPFITCGARLPVYVLIVAAFFPDYEAEMLTLMYALSIFFAAMMALVLRKVFFGGSSGYLLLELPLMLPPTLRGPAMLSYRRSKSFVKTMATWIALGSIMIWALSVFGSSGFLGAEALEDPELLEKAFISDLGHFFAPLFSPMNWDWRAVVALIFGFVAKEIVVAIMGVLYAGGSELSVSAIAGNLATVGGFTPLSAFSFMVFVLLYAPCLGTIIVTKREAGTKWMLVSITITTATAWIVAALICLIGGIWW